MTDFEDRLSSALREVGDDAPDAVGLAPAARGRARARSRRTALTSVAAVVAVVGVVGGVALLSGRDDDPRRTPVADDPTPTVTDSSTPVIPGARLESWRDVSVQVPTAWGYGTLSTWCLSEVPVVERPGGVVRAIGCGPWNNGYGVRFFDGSAINLAYPPGHVWQYEKGDVEEYPDGAWLGYERGSGDNLVWVVAKDRGTVEQVIGSFVRNTDVDPNGCPTRAVEGPPVEAGSLRLCRYTKDRWLEQSEVLTGSNAAAAVEALEDAVPLGNQGLCPYSGPSVQITSAGAEGYLTLNPCDGFTWDGVARELTTDAIYWALSPGWSGAVPGKVPMPEKPRQ